MCAASGRLHQGHQPQTHHPEPAALGHTHGHGELTVGHIQNGLALTYHQAAAAIAMWAEGGIGMPWKGKKGQVIPQPSQNLGLQASSGQSHPAVTREEGLVPHTTQTSHGPWSWLSGNKIGKHVEHVHQRVSRSKPSMACGWRVTPNY